MAIRNITVGGNSKTNYFKTNPAADNVISRIGATSLSNTLENYKKNNQTSTNKTNSSTVKSSGTKTSTASSGTNSASYQNALAQMYAQQQAQATALQAQQRAAAEDAYNKGMNRLNDAFNAKSGALRNNLNSTLESLGRQYNTSKGEVTNDANKSLREAYVNYMLNKKNINQNLAAQGIAGGAAESTMANMYNNYGNSRNDINTTLNDNLASLENTYQNNVASANQQYNNAYADAMAQYLTSQSQMEQNLANNIIGSYGDMISSMGSLNTDYAKALSKLLANQSAYTAAPTQNTLAVDNVTTTQASNLGGVTDWAKYQAAMDNMYSYGATDEDVAVYLDRLGASPSMALNLINNRNATPPFANY